MIHEIPPMPARRAALPQIDHAFQAQPAGSTLDECARCRRGRSAHPAIAMRPFTADDWTGLAGAEAFADGRQPQIGEIKIGAGEEALLVRDASGLQLVGDGWWADKSCEERIALATIELLPAQPSRAQLEALGFRFEEPPGDDCASCEGAGCGDCTSEGAEERELAESKEQAQAEDAQERRAEDLRLERSRQP